MSTTTITAVSPAYAQQLELPFPEETFLDHSDAPDWYLDVGMPTNAELLAWEQEDKAASTATMPRATSKSGGSSPQQ